MKSLEPRLARTPIASTASRRSPSAVSTARIRVWAEAGAYGVTALLALGLASCSAGQRSAQAPETDGAAEAPEPGSPTASASVPASPPQDAPAAAPSPTSPSAPASSAPEAEARAPETTAKPGFPPPPITPPHERSAHEGDGQWTPLGNPGDRAAEGAPVLYKTVLHPHPSSRFISLTVVAIDLEATRVHFMPGADDVGTKKLPFTPGLVPAERQDALLAVFNGGFMPRHGRWGMQLGDVNVVPPRDIGCTIVIMPDGAVSIRSFSAVADRVAKAEAFRQTPPCLVEQGAIHPDLLAGRDKIWAGQNPNLVTRRRSAIGIDATGRVLLYGIGVETSARVLAEGMRFAGARDAAELDINWNWTRFLLYGKNDAGQLRVTSTLVEGEYAKSGYVARPSQRDFFYVVRR